MKLDKKNVAVLIESESQLQQAREILERYGEYLNRHTGFYEGSQEGYNYLKFYSTCWELMYNPCGQKITLTELEEILKGEKDE